jgi:hypothetical protein
MSFRHYLKRVRHYLSPTSRKPQSRKHHPRLQLESLEDRTVPTVLFYPQFGGEALTTDGGGAKLSHPPVYLIFWGPSSLWGDSASNAPSALADQIEKAGQAFIDFSPYLSGLCQYGSDGTAYVAEHRIDNSTPPAVFPINLLNDVVYNATHNSPYQNLPNNVDNAIYFVITPPGTTYQDPQTGLPSTGGGYNEYNGNFHVGWLGTSGSTATQITDSATVILSHELVETITDPDGNGIHVQHSSQWTGGGDDQISDGENELYRYRVNGSLVEPYWSYQRTGQLLPDLAYVVPDGTPSDFVVTGGNNLVVRGDQFLLPQKDTITVAATAAAGVTVQLNGDVATFEPGAISTVLVNPGGSFGGVNTINVQSVPAGANVIIDTTTAFTPSASDTVTVGAAGSVQGIKGSVSILNSSTAFTTLTVNDMFDPAYHNSVTVSDFAISGLAPVDITYFFNPLTALTVFGGGPGPAVGGSGGNTFNVPSIAGSTPGGTTTARGSGTLVTLYTGPGNDTVNVGGPSQSLDTLLGGLKVDGQGGNDTVNVNDAGSTSDYVYDVTNFYLNRLTAGVLNASITSDHLETLNLKAGTGRDTLQLRFPITALQVNLDGGSGPGTNTLQGPNVPTSWLLNAPNGGTLGTKVSFAAVQTVKGGTATDTFQFTPSGQVTTLDGGGGSGDGLDYSAFGPSDSVVVNLLNQTATGVTGTIASIVNVTGGKGDDLLVGDKADNVLVGGAGRNVLIGGVGSDTLTGGTGDDLLIGGWTDFDGNYHNQLTAIFKEWRRTDLPGTVQQQYHTRFKHLAGQLLDGQYSGPYLTLATVHDDNGATDTLSGGPGGQGLDWFWAYGADLTPDWVSGLEHKNNV